MPGFTVIQEEPIALDRTYLPFWHGWYGICFSKMTRHDTPWIVCSGLGTEKKKWVSQEKWRCPFGKVFRLKKVWQIWEGCEWHRIVEREGEFFLQGLR